MINNDLGMAKANAKIHSSFGLMIVVSTAQLAPPWYRASTSCPGLAHCQIRSRYEIVPFEDQFWDWRAKAEN